MTDATSTAATGEPLTTYTFRVVVEPDEDVWHAYCPALKAYGAATWGASRREAVKNIRDVVEMVVAELVEDGDAIPADAQVVDEALVSVTV